MLVKIYKIAIIIDFILIILSGAVMMILQQSGGWWWVMCLPILALYLSVKRSICFIKSYERGMKL
jgi:hypothetical protein